MSKFELEVKILEIGETQEVGASGFKKRNLIGETFGEYKQTLQFEFVQDKVDILDEYIAGEAVKVHFNIRGRAVEKTGKPTMYFTTLSGWKIEA